jgi:serine/threonine protein kinase/WD40 repeat protein
MEYLPEGRKGTPAEDDPRLHSPTLLSPVVPGARKEEPDEVGMGERAGGLVDELLGEPTVHDKRGPIYAELIKDRIDALNRFFERGPDSKAKYKVLELIGRGGMGAVFKAEQRSPIKRLVALKLVKPGYDSKEVIARFESERQALARMDHGSVAKVLDAGADDMGRPYFVMEYVPGVSITEFADRNKLTIRQRLELFVDVCSAIAHAHSKSIIHRDIKAGNVLAYFEGGKPVVKVIDFGIAKALTGDRLTDLTMNTRHGQLLGTYESMSPEQAEGSPDIDTRTDVYSLGALLYELLTGAAPFDREMFSKAADQEIRRIIREVEPPRPSTRLTSLGEEGTKVAEARQEPLAELAEELRTELEWIPLMAMRKSRDRRYATPLELADDIERYLEHRPLKAGPESKWYVAKKTVRRHRFGIAVSAAVVVALAVGLVVSMLAMGRAWRAEAKIAQKVEEIENSMAFGGDYEMQRGDLISARRLYVNALDKLREHNETSSAVLAGLNELESLEQGEIPLLGNYGEDGGIAAFRGHTRHPNNVAILPDKRRALTAGSDGQLFLWDLLIGREIASRQSVGDVSLAYVAVASDGSFAATAGKGGKVGLWDIDTLKEHTFLEKPDDKELYIVAISPDGKRVVAGTYDGDLWFWERKGNWKHATKLWHSTESIQAITFPPDDSDHVLVGDGNCELTFWDLKTAVQRWAVGMKPRRSIHGLNCALFSEDGLKLATANFDGSVILWDVHGNGADLTIASKQVLVELRGKAWRVAFSQDGKQLAVGADDGVVRVYSTDRGALSRQSMAQNGAVNGVAFVDNITLAATGDDTMSADGKSLLAALRLWDLSDRGVVLPDAVSSPAKSIVVSNSGQVVVRTESGRSIEGSFGFDGRVRESSGGSDPLSLTNAAGDYADALGRTTWAKGEQRVSTTPKANAEPAADAWRKLAVSGDGAVSVVTRSRNELELQRRPEGGDASTFLHVRTLRGHVARVVAAGISPNGRFVVSVDEHGRCLGWDLLRPAVCRDFERDLGVLRDPKQTANLRKWFTFRGREDLGSAVK